ncbi:MAG: hypothetical protein INR62_09450 [Rhodospirillales bacterium]|nr:hypothetical protein [Acetobacter sp.]
MNANDVLQRLVRDGALIEDAHLSGMLLLPIVAELVTPAPGHTPPAAGWLYWVDAGAEDQHHTHFRPYADVQVIHERDVRFTDAAGKQVAYVAPIMEWPLEDYAALRERLAVARHEVAAYQEHFDRFVADCRPGPAVFPAH